ncbi:MAG TPA: hypothetical protein VK171_02480 [Fimbriimonas sp.]|nr:hypothetical protein [Fimbriimonas sp.]
MAPLEFEPTVGAKTETQIYKEPEATVVGTNQSGKLRANYGVIGLVALPLLVVGVLLAQARSMADVITEDDHLEARLEQAKQKGLILDPRPFYTTGVADADNAFIPLNQHFLIDDPKFDLARNEVFSEKQIDSPSMSDELKTLVGYAKLVAARSRFSPQSAATKPLSLRAQDYTAHESDRKVFGAMKLAARVLAYDAQFKARHGDREGALESLLEVRKLAAIFTEIQSSTAMLVGITLQGLADQAGRKIAHYANDDPKTLRKLTEIVSVEVPTLSHLELVRFDYALRSTTLRDTDQAVTEVPKSIVKRSALSLLTDYYLKKTTILEQERDPVVAQAKIDELNGATSPKLSTTLNVDVGAEAKQIIVAPSRSAARRMLSLWVIELEGKYKGNWPEKLPPRNDKAYGGKLIHRKTDDGFTVYSNGPNRRDDGGVAKYDADGTPLSDDVFVNHRTVQKS